MQSPFRAKGTEQNQSHRSADTRNSEGKKHEATSQEYKSSDRWARGSKNTEQIPRGMRESNIATSNSKAHPEPSGTNGRGHTHGKDRSSHHRESKTHDREGQKSRGAVSRRPHGREDEDAKHQSRDAKARDGGESKNRESRSRRPREGNARDRSQRDAGSTSRVPPLTRRPIWGERGEDTCAPNHKILRDKAPDHTDAPWYVRMWIAAYMRYRGLDDNLAAGVHYTGAEFYELSLEDVVELFIHKCGVKDKEAQILGRDVWECVHVSFKAFGAFLAFTAKHNPAKLSAQIKQPSTSDLTSLQRYANFVGEDVQRLHDLVAKDSGVFTRILSIFFWARAFIKMIAMTYVGIIFAVIVIGCISVFVFESEKAKKAQV
ncbi:hypothetical protein PFICI_02099 [Pestalotiopsis fici W106-1]|uniref:Uncharacterized protein n=1 Tax=Pestalotiopsis fici (strain W106-1 / CGMCC3.15140) TaxID=1229662 RepID=W3XSU3_PESFW|nr:uncharacterized protein PFICI_02099 [Pestalotiopsis fici W106-1]ETS88271.1 hypothetical protein PFICI_02099 [Pestalotiopsis fici W106-1]